MSAPNIPASIIQLRSAQSEFVRGVEKYGLVAFVARRQFGKTTTFSAIALKKMMKRKNHTVVFGSSKLTLAREIIRKEAEVIQKAIVSLVQQAEIAGGMFEAVDSRNGKPVAKLSEDDLAEVYEAQSMEFRFYHSKTIYSRTKVVALNPNTVGETGDLMCDEIGRIRNWREVWEAVEPIVSSNPDFRLTLSTTPPPDDAHYSFEMLMPPLGMDFPISPKGNWYRSEMGVMVLRVSAADAYADGVPVYDLETREPLAPEEHRRRAHDKDAWDRNYGIQFLFGGTAAVGILELEVAQRRGIGQCRCIIVESDTDFDIALAFLREKLSANPVGVGIDLATTEKQTSNPTSVTIMEAEGVERWSRLTIVWKTRDPAIAKDRIKRIIITINSRPVGGPARRLCIDATNERYFAIELQRELGGEVPTELVIASETIAQDGEMVTYKAYLGNLLCNSLGDNRFVLAPERYIKEDFRLVRRNKGSFDTEVSPSGQHGDTFDSHKLALWALQSTTGGALESTKGIHVGAPSRHHTLFMPRRFQ